MACMSNAERRMSGLNRSRNLLLALASGPVGGLGALLVAVGLVASHPAAGQIAEINKHGVAMGHLHYFVEDVDANREFWLALGGSRVPSATLEIVRMPGVLIFLAQSEAGSDRSVLDHVAFRVRSLDEIAARGFDLELVEAFPGIASVYTPAGDRVELFEEGTATNVWFEFDSGADPDGLAGRHNRPLVGPIDSHHLHFYLPEPEVESARDWYVEHFGAVAGLRWRYLAADLPGMNLNFSATDPARVATRGQSLGHIGFEVENLEAFCAELEAAGIEFDQPFQRVSATLALAVLTDPWGTTIELSEGLASL
jgi:catechol 2,3-dioxygenase-like lactoylglutathione lyase family enzyme